MDQNTDRNGLRSSRRGRVGQPVENYAASLANRIDRLIDATIRGDWDEVRGLSHQISYNSAAYGYSNIAQAANRLCASIGDDVDEWDVTHGVVLLAESCCQSTRAAG